MLLTEAQSELADQLNALTGEVLLLERRIAERQANGQADAIYGLQRALAARRRQADAVQEQLRTIV